MNIFPSRLKVLYIIMGSLLGPLVLSHAFLVGEPFLLDRVAHADGSDAEGLGEPAISISTGTGIVGAGTGLKTQPGTIQVTVPDDAEVRQVLLYWSGAAKQGSGGGDIGGDSSINVNGIPVDGVRIGGPDFFFRKLYFTSFRADITALNLVRAGENILTVDGMNYGPQGEDDGAGVLVIYDDGSRDSQIAVRDGIDLAYCGFDSPRDETITQTFDITPLPFDRIANMVLFFGSVADGEDRPTSFEVTVGSQTTRFSDLLASNDEPQWDTVNLPARSVTITIPSGESSVKVRAFSRDDNNGGPSECPNDPKPASFSWIVASLAVAPADPAIAIQKLTNGIDADTPDAPDVPEIAPGAPITWTYEVLNTGNIPFAEDEITVSDNLAGPVTLVEKLGNGDDTLAPGETWRYQAAGVAVDLLADTSGLLVAGCTPARPTYVNIGTVNAGSGSGTASAADRSHYCNPLVAAIDIEKATNGVDADAATGPEIDEGEPVNWTYVVTNVGKVPLTNIAVSDNDPTISIDCRGKTALAVNESMPCTASSTARPGQYANLGMAVGETATGATVADSDPSHYLGRKKPGIPGVDLEKSTNGLDADAAPGPEITIDDPVTWVYTVTNIGAVTLTNIIVTDSDPALTVNCGGQTTLVPYATLRCTATGTATLGQYENLGTVTGIGASIPVSDTDPSHYQGQARPGNPGIDLEKSTNSQNADTGPGPDIIEGTPVTWTYTVANIGDVALSNVIVMDSDPALTVNCGDQTTLAVDRSMTCTATGVARLGQYTNTGTVSGTAPSGEIVTDMDNSHYRGIPKPTPPPPVERDWGDAPDSGTGTGQNNYRTRVTDNGPRHRINPKIYMGSPPDAEDDGLPTPNADGDDSNGFTDEDGLTSDACFIRGKPAILNVTVTNQLSSAANLYGWIDFDADGRFADTPVTTTPVAAGSVDTTIALNFGTVPLNDAVSTFLRLRLSSDSAAAQPVGEATDGEVEDYKVVIATPAITSTVQQVFQQIGQTATVTATANTTCGTPTNIPVCWRVADNQPECGNTGNGGETISTYACTADGVFKTTVWLDLNGNKVKESSEPAHDVDIVCGESNVPDALTLEPLNKDVKVGTTHTVTAAVTKKGIPVASQSVAFIVSGAHDITSQPFATDSEGRATFTYTGTVTGSDTIRAVATTSSGQLTAIANVVWHPNYTLTLTPLPPERIVGTRGLLTVRVTDQNNSPVPGKRIQFAVDGLNTAPAATAPTPTDSDGKTRFEYPYTSDRNSYVNGDPNRPYTDTVTAIVTGTFTFSQTTIIAWQPVSMTVRVADNPPVRSRNVLIAVEPLKAITDTGSVTVEISQTNLLGTGIRRRDAVDISLESVNGSDQRALRRPPAQQPFTLEEPVDPIVPFNRIHPGCDIKLGESAWVIIIWTDLDRNGRPSGEEPTCYVEEPTILHAPIFTAQHRADSVILRWKTSTEAEIAGFNLYRALDVAGPYALLNESTIVAQGNALGTLYEYADHPPDSDRFYYRLEIVDTAGMTTLVGPLRVEYAEGASPSDILYLPVIVRE